jgi:predicted RNA-binding Zn ribbon-like protein
MMQTKPLLLESIARGDHLAQTAEFIAGAWCLDFANTVEPRSIEKYDYVPDYRTLISWSVKAGMIQQRTAPTLRERADTAAAAAAHRRAIKLRETTYRLFHAIATGDEPATADLTALRDAHADAIAHAVPRWDDGLQWSWPDDDLERPRRMLTDDAVRLLESSRVERVKMCRPSCGWLFLDLTRNASRRWCSTDACGVREKIRRQAERRAARREG